MKKWAVRQRLWKTLRCWVLSRPLQLYADLWLRQRWWSGSSHSPLDPRSEHSCSGPKQARIGPAKPFLQSSVFWQKSLSSACGVHNPFWPCDRIPAGYCGVARLHSWSFPIHLMSMWGCTLYSISYQEGLPHSLALIFSLSVARILSQVLTCPSCSVGEFANKPRISGTWSWYCQGSSSSSPVKSSLWCSLIWQGSRHHFLDNTFAAGAHPDCMYDFV